jgi:hypothetical protein
VKYCCAAHFENAVKKAEKYGLLPAEFEEILEDGEVELVVILTPVPAHYGLIRRALEAGKHVYTEKTITDAEAHQVSVFLSQTDTLGLSNGTAQVQLNWTYPDGNRACTNIVNIDVTPNLLKAVMA